MHEKLTGPQEIRPDTSYDVYHMFNLKLFLFIANIHWPPVVQGSQAATEYQRNTCHNSQRPVV